MYDVVIWYSYVLRSFNDQNCYSIEHILHSLGPLGVKQFVNLVTWKIIPSW